MGESAAETVVEIEQIRDRLDRELRELEHRVPAPAEAGKRLGQAAAIGGAAGIGLWMVTRLFRGAKRRVMRVPGGDNRQVIVLPREAFKDDDDGPGFFTIALTAAGAIMAMRKMREKQAA